jgi:hypothetical protein
MSTVQYEARVTDDARRSRLYAGDIFVYAPTAATKMLCDFARDLVEKAFAPHDPRHIHEILPVEQCVAILAELKPRFIHHPQSKKLLAEILAGFGCDPQETHFDVPRLRSAMPSDYLSSGIAYAFHAHRDTWYSAPLCQLNWWLPIYALTEENCMAFHPRYWDQAVRNTSRTYNYAKWNQEGRKVAAQQIKNDTREQPHAQEPLQLEPSLRLLCPPGGLILFSAAQLHSTVPNTSGIARYSIDFRTVHKADAAARIGAMNIDSASTGTTMGDYLRVSDLAHLPEPLIAAHEIEGAAGYPGPGAVGQAH